MRQAGRYLPEYREIRERVGGFLDVCYTPELAAEVTLQPIRRYGFDAAILFSDILLVPHALGREVEFRTEVGPVLEPLREDGVAKLSQDGIEERLEAVYAAARVVKRELPSEVALIGFAGAPWTVAAYMIEGRGGTDFANVIRWAWQAPASFGVLIDILTGATVRHLSAQIFAGAEAVQLFDSWAGIAAEPLFRYWCLDPAREIVARLNDLHPGVPVIGFPRAAGANLIAYARETGIACLGLDTSVPLDWAARELQPYVAVQGSLDPILLAAGGAALQVEARRICAELAGGPHVFNLGHGIRKETPPEHVQQLLEAVRGDSSSRLEV
jgi:uroporphyrinogen decarboxylase